MRSESGRAFAVGDADAPLEVERSKECVGKWVAKSSSAVSGSTDSGRVRQAVPSADEVRGVGAFHPARPGIELFRFEKDLEGNEISMKCLLVHVEHVESELARSEETTYAYVSLPGVRCNACLAQLRSVRAHRRFFASR